MTTSALLTLGRSDLKNCCFIIKSYNVNFSRRKHYDVAIAGGGLVGTAMACAVAKNYKLSDKSIIVFETSPQTIFTKKSLNDEYSNRVFSLNPGTRKFFESLGAWSHVTDVRYKVVKKLQIWDACSDSLIVFNDDMVNDMSYIVENNVVLYSLQEVSKNLENIDFKYESRIKNIELPKLNEPVKLEMENGDKYTCSLLVGAEGPNSPTRKALGCQYLSWSYNQKGVVATLKLSEPWENSVAWQRFLPDGVVALLPLTDELSSLVWSTETKKAEELLRLSHESFLDAVNDAFWKVYPKSDLVTSAVDSLNKVMKTLSMKSDAVRQLPPCVASVIPNTIASYPLGFGHSTKYIGPRVALVGDAAHRVHPLSGLGVNLGFADVECLVSNLAESVYNGNKIGSPSALAQYESERQAKVLPTIGTIDLLQKLYNTSFTPIVLLRSLGLQITNALDPVKRMIIKQASG